MQEKTVDATLDAFLKKPVTTNVKNNKDREDLANDSELPDDVEDDEPCTQAQRDEIWGLFCDLNTATLDPAKLAQLQKMNEFTKSEAENMINMCKSLRANNFSKVTTKNVMEMVSRELLHESVVKTEMDRMLSDDVLVSEMNAFFGTVLSKLGRLRGPFMFGIYILSNMRRYSAHIINESKSSITYPEGSHAPPTVPVDDGGTIADGQNNVADKTHAVLLGKHNE